MNALLLLGAIAAGSAIIQDNGGVCFLPADIMILQDTTGSFMDDMPIVRGQIPDLVEKVRARFPGSRFGVAEFRDKPYFPLGEPDDFCYKLRYGQLTDSPTMLQFAWDILQPSGGGDYYEDHFQAGIDVVLDKEIGWRDLVPGAYSVRTGKADLEVMEDAISHMLPDANLVSAHIVIMITDAEPHYPGDMHMCAPGAPGWQPDWNCPQNLPDNLGFLKPGPEACTDYDYPAPGQFIKVVMTNDVVFFFLTTASASPFWADFSTNKLNNPPAFHQQIAENSQNLTDAIISALEGLAEVACPATTTPAPTEAPTTEAPTTTPTTTPAPTTTPTTTPAPTTTPTTTPAPTTTPTTPAPTEAPTTTPAPTEAPTTTPAVPVTTAGTPETTAPPTPATTTPAVPVTTAGTPETTAPPNPATTTTPAPAPTCECHGHPECPCDELIVKIGPSVKKFHMSFGN